MIRAWITGVLQRWTSRVMFGGIGTNALLGVVDSLIEKSKSMGENSSSGAIMDTDKRPPCEVEQPIRKEMRQCECGGYRLAAVYKDGHHVWAAGCRACDTIERLNILLEAGVKVTRGSKATMDPRRLREQRDRAEEEIENLKKEVSRLTDERNAAQIEAKRARSSAKAAQAAAERMRQGCHIARMAGPEWN